MIETIHLSFGNLIIGALFFIIPLYALYAFKVEIWGAHAQGAGHDGCGADPRRTAHGAGRPG